MRSYLPILTNGSSRNPSNRKPFEEDGSLIAITIEALSGAFQTAFKNSIITDAGRLRFWMENRERIKQPIYVRAMIEGMQEHVKARNFDKLSGWFTFCEWVLSHPDQEQDESQEQPDWRNSRRAVGDFIGACLEKDVAVPLSFRGQLAKLLDMLCTQFDWRLDHGEPIRLNRDDQLTEAINNTRSRALEDLVNFGFWMRRHGPTAEGSEITKTLEKRFTPEAEYRLTPPEHAILGKNYQYIFGLDKAWTTEHRSDFFPQDAWRKWLEAFGNFLRFTPPGQPIFDVVLNDFEFALEHLDRFKQQKQSGQELTDDLGEHLFTYYLWEVYPLKGESSLLECFYLKTDGERKHWATLFGYVGRSLRNTRKLLDEGLKDRIIAFFECRLEVGEPTELQRFTFWLEAECMEAEWRLRAYSRILDVLKVLDASQRKDQRARISSDALQPLRAMLPKHIAGVVECFAKLTDSMPKSGATYIRTDHAKAILKAGREYEDESVRENAWRARENLLQRGYFSIMD